MSYQYLACHNFGGHIGGDHTICDINGGDLTIGNHTIGGHKFGGHVIGGHIYGGHRYLSLTAESRVRVRAAVFEFVLRGHITSAISGYIISIV